MIVSDQLSTEALCDRPRQNWMTVLARSSAAVLTERLVTAPELPEFVHLRGPEVGLVMLRGRAGGDGAAFNLGEMSVTRCSIRDNAGRIGHAWRAGRDARAAELAARLDAVLQEPALFQLYHDAVVTPLAEAQSALRTQPACKAAATEVQFFTLATMRS